MRVHRADLLVECRETTTNLSRLGRDLARLPDPSRLRVVRQKKVEPLALSGDEAEEALRRRKERVNRVLNNVLACLNHAFDNEKVPTNAAWSKLKRFKGTEQPRVRWLDLDETRRLINACAPDFRKIVQGALLTGARWSELRRIRVQDYDSEAGTVLIARTKRKKARHVYLTDEGRRAFVEWTTGSERAAAVFVWAEGSNWGSHDQHRPIAAAREACKLSDDVTFHVLRHYFSRPSMSRSRAKTL